MEATKKKITTINKLLWRKYGNAGDFKKKIENSKKIDVMELIKEYPNGLTKEQIGYLSSELEKYNKLEVEYYETHEKLYKKSPEELIKMEEDIKNSLISVKDY